MTGSRPGLDVALVIPIRSVKHSQEKLLDIFGPLQGESYSERVGLLFILTLQDNGYLESHQSPIKPTSPGKRFIEAI